MEKIFEHKKADIHFNAEYNSIELVWKEMHDTETYKFLFTKVLTLIKQSQATGFLSDIRKEGVVGPGNSKWLREEILPQAYANGLKKIAVVMDSDVFKTFYVNNITKAAGNDTMKYFHSTESANEWLSQN